MIRREISDARRETAVTGGRMAVTGKRHGDRREKCSNRRENSGKRTRGDKRDTLQLHRALPEDITGSPPVYVVRAFQTE